ncbi:conjugal transfer protein [Croceitalea marina]|uniref:Conjugal transfer protein n=1 Tax=Croceitalea marina TaxID=1775166 RepID=A0ABW5MTG3_9FLAO
MKTKKTRTFRKNVRTIITTTVFILLIKGHGVAQGMPVYDNTNFIGMAKSLVESAKQTAELLKTVEFLKEQKDNIVKVNNAIQQLKAVRELARNHDILLRTVRQDLNAILGSPFVHPEEVEQISTSFELIMATAIDDLDFINHILSSDFLKMSDAERTAMLKEKERQSQEMAAEITKKTQRYRDIIDFRRMQDLINNRETNY